ncbi:MAG: alpha/beta fold hydrolase [Chlamydiales bacterium]|nr:alpha/beta fold hydrolase [Chlamydiia bacterium]MCP5508223.1 alpha/beta fold hydrolase [Chlamydiales bacterium]
MIAALHGFLGRADDWHLPGVNGYDIYKIAKPGKKCGMNEWAATFNRVAEEKILMGYSLGGRLALHALIQHPERWNAAVIVSAHPGMPYAERDERIKQDAVWAERFLNDDWDTVIKDWNNQSVFSGQQLFRDKKNYCRKKLADSLCYWSLGKQDYLFDKIADLPMPILWVIGERDTKFCSLAAQVRLKNKRSEIWVAQDAGHRVPWENGQLFKKKIEEFGAHYANAN